MQVIPLQPVPSQAVSVLLNSQACNLNVYQRSTGLFIDVLIEDQLIIGGVICQDRNRIVRSLYLGFSGDLAFIDNQGMEDPTSDLIGNRFFLCYFLPEEVPLLATL